MTDNHNKHDASASATGYLYQCRYALLVGIRAIPASPELSISIEKFDDIAFDLEGEPADLIQTKHHLSKAGNLSDASIDLWKTLHIWTRRVADNVNAPFRVRFLLLTTSAAPDGSAASLLRVRDRDEAEADKRLMRAAHGSTNQANVEAYSAYKHLPDEQRLNLLKAVTIVDGSPNILDVHDEICREVRLAAPRGHVEHLVERLEGWWYGVVIKALVMGPGSIPVLAIDNRIDELREEFRRNSLPIDFAGQDPPAAVVAELDKRPFVRQLRHIEVGVRRIEYAIRDYYRASEQRSKWAREDLLVDGELENYERELIEAWQPRFAAMMDGLTAASGASTRATAGRTLFTWVETEASFPLRTVRDRFLTHGSYHILSNRYMVGWHPDFETLRPEAGGED